MNMTARYRSCVKNIQLCYNEQISTNDQFNLIYILLVLVHSAIKNVNYTKQLTVQAKSLCALKKP